MIEGEPSQQHAVPRSREEIGEDNRGVASRAYSLLRSGPHQLRPAWRALAFGEHAASHRQQRFLRERLEGLEWAYDVAEPLALERER